jgi:hypothetical protein
MVKNLESMHKSSNHRWFVRALWSNGSYHWVGTNLASLHLSKWLQVNFNLFFYYIQDFGWFNRQLLWRLLCRENGWSTGLSLHSSSHWINEPALCQLPCLLGMVDKVWNCHWNFEPVGWLLFSVNWVWIFVSRWTSWYLNSWCMNVFQDYVSPSFFVEGIFDICFDHCCNKFSD